jgi:hypothetical protein
MGNNDMATAITVAFLSIVLVLSVPSLSFGAAYAQDNTSDSLPSELRITNNASGNSTSNSNLGNITTFTASGFLRSTIVPHQDPLTPYIIFGYWNASVNTEDLTNFVANFTMSRVNGSQMHSHQITNFKPTSGIFLNNEAGTSLLIFAGTSDVYTNNQPKWNNVDTSVIIDNFNTISIALDSRGTDNHFNGQELGGVIESVKDPSNKELLLLVLEPAAIIVPGPPSSETSTPGDQANATENKGNADILSNIGEAIKKLFSFG